MLPVGNMEMVIFYVYNFYTHGCAVFTCKNGLYTSWYHFYTHACNVFTCENVLYTRSYIFYSHRCNVFIHIIMFFTLADTTSIPIDEIYLHARMFCTLAHTSSIPFPWVQCNYTCKNVFYTHWYDLLPIVCTNFYLDNLSLAHANRAMVTNNLTVIIEVVLI